MKTRIGVEIDGRVYEGHIDDGVSPITAKKLLDSLPISATPVCWGGEFYFDVPFHVGPENSTDDLKVGDICFWPPGDVLCIFFGRTPISTNDRPKPASAVNVVGFLDDARRLSRLSEPSRITIRII